MDKSKFLAVVTQAYGELKPTQLAGFDVVLAALDGLPLSHRAYATATPWWETNRTMQPVREAYWLSEGWRKEHLRYYPWYGRGYVQLTWEADYKRADEELGLKGALLANPDKAMDPAIAARILREGMVEGWFTGVSLAKVLPPSGIAKAQQYINARTIINGHDKATDIELVAQVFERAYRAAGVV